jgi:hypothetical protein
VNHEERLSPFFPEARERRPEQTIPTVQAGALLLSLVDGELLTEGKIFQYECAVALDKEQSEAK